MHIRRDRKDRGEKSKTYLSLAHNVREKRGDGRSQAKPVIFANLGAEEDLDQTLVVGAVAALQRYIEQRWGQGSDASKATQVTAAARKVRQSSAALKILCSKQLGLRLLLEPVWEELGIGPALRKVEKKRDFEFPLERIVFGMVFNRLVDPQSKLACNDWLKDQAFFPEGEDWEVHHFYRALDVLHDHWAEIEEALFDALSARTPEPLRLLQLVDTTSLYFESRLNDEERGEVDQKWAAFLTGNGEQPRHPMPQVVNDPPFRMQGHNKDGHPGDPQVVVASVCLPNGLILRHKVYAGQTPDVTIAADLIETVCTNMASRRIWCSDAGMTSAARQRELDDMGWDRLTAEAPRKSAYGLSHVLPTAGRYRQHPRKPNFQYKSMAVNADQSPSGKAETWLVTRNLVDRERQLEQVDKHVGQVKAALSVRESDGTHSKAVCKTVSHPSLKRYVTRSETVPGRYVLNQEAVKTEKMLAGTRLYRSTLTDWDSVELFDAYQLLQELERDHRTMKGPLELRPCYHRAAHRIRAHVMLMIMSVNVVRVLEAKTGQTFETLRKLFKPLDACKIQQGDTTHWQRTELTVEQEAVLTKAGIALPPETWTRWKGCGSTAKAK